MSNSRYRLSSLDKLGEPRDERLSEGVAEHKLRSYDENLRIPKKKDRTHQYPFKLILSPKTQTTHLGCQPFEQRHRSLISKQLPHHRHTADLALEIRILDASLDRVEWGCNRDGSDGARDGRYEVLAPSRLGVIRDSKQVVLRHRRCTE